MRENMNYPLFKIVRKISINGMRIEECMAQYPHPQPYSGLALPQLCLGGYVRHLRPRVTPSEPSNNQRYAQNNALLLCPPNFQICG